jgi:hypothetical protein
MEYHNYLVYNKKSVELTPALKKDILKIVNSFKVKEFKITQMNRRDIYAWETSIISEKVNENCEYKIDNDYFLIKGITFLIFPNIILRSNFRKQNVDFIKTDHNPIDTIIKILLLIIKKHYPFEMSIAHDGDRESFFKCLSKDEEDIQTFNDLIKEFNLKSVEVENNYNTKEHNFKR